LIDERALNMRKFEGRYHTTYVSKHFKISEFYCKCCGKVKVDSILVQMLDRLRDWLGTPLYVTSGYRCASHNRAVGGADKSYHMKGQAADVHCKGEKTVKEIAEMARRVGFGGIKEYKNFVHVDIGPKRSW